MAQVKLSNIVKHFDDGTKVIHGIDLDISDGEFVVFVGPSGCGKSTLLRMIAGLESITSGALWIGGQRANEIAPARRGLAMVFQSYALYPHMSVYENMAFSLKLAGLKAVAIDIAVQRAAAVLQITPLLKRKPKDLSGGQRQRVAIGRAIVRQPQVFLFDEPLSNLDAGLRVQMRLELSRLHQELGATMLYVTHDQVEAMTLGQRIVVLHRGRIEQVGTPAQLYLRPANLFVAGFLGAPKMNLLPARVSAVNGGLVQLTLSDESVLQVPVGAATIRLGELVTLGIRAEHIVIGLALHNTVNATVAVVEFLGDACVVYARMAATQELVAFKQPVGQGRFKAGQACCMHLPAGHCHLFDRHGRAIDGVN